MSSTTEKVFAQNPLVNDKAFELLFSDLFKAHEYTLYTLAVRLLKDDNIAKDIIQDVFLSLWNIRERLSDINNIEAYLFNMTRFRVFKQLQKISADNQLRENIWMALKDLAEDGRSVIEAREFHSVLTIAIERLPPKRKKVYMLKTSEGKSYKNIAEELNISQHTVKNHLSSAVEFIRKFVNTASAIFVIASMI